MQPYPHRLFLGTSAWTHKDWVGNFYPANTTPRTYLSEYAKRLTSVEIDSTFYAIPKATVVEGWREKTPDSFVFAAKFPKTITHEKRLIDCQEEVAAFVEVMSLLGPKLGPLLLQFPVTFQAHEFDTLARFLDSLPDGFRYAVEVRHHSWLDTQFFDCLREHGVAFALVDSPWLPRTVITTTDFTYIRWMGDRNEPFTDFSRIRLDRSEDLQWWANQVLQMQQADIGIYGYFNNHYAGHSPSTLEKFLDYYRQIQSAEEGAAATTLA